MHVLHACTVHVHSTCTTCACACSCLCTWPGLANALNCMSLVDLSLIMASALSSLPWPGYIIMQWCLRSMTACVSLASMHEISPKNAYQVHRLENEVIVVVNGVWLCIPNLVVVAYEISTSTYALGCRLCNKEACVGIWTDQFSRNLSA